MAAEACPFGVVGPLTWVVAQPANSTASSSGARILAKRISIGIGGDRTEEPATILPLPKDPH
jgi:hypothetical protein